MQVTEQMENKLTANMNISKKDIILGNFLGGFFWGVGSVVGAGIVVAAIGLVLNSLGIFSAIGGLFSSLDTATKQLQQLPQVPQIYR